MKIRLDYQVQMQQLRNERRQWDQTFIVNLFKAISWLLMAVLGYWFHLAGLGLWSALKEFIRRSSE